MTITATVIEDSYAEKHGTRLTTLQLRYHRYAHAEFLTHRLFSRNSSSSRAIPVERLIADVERDPAEPIHWGRNQKGMQARAQLWGEALNTAKALWREDREHSILMAKEMAKIGAHKQIVNRLIENHGHINVVVTATEWANFLYVRDHEDALPEIGTLAHAIRVAMEASTPKLILKGEYHLPYVGMEERRVLPIEQSILASTARCARVSYLTHEGRHPPLEDDVRLAYDLIKGDPKHATPAEHQATPADDAAFIKNFRGWRMHRASIPNEAVW